MAITYENVNPTPIANATVQKVYINGVHKVYYINPNEGYVLHDTDYDNTNVDPITGDEIVVLGYGTSIVSCRADYDFTANPRQFYAVLRDSVPENQIFGVTEPDHEVMSQPNTEETATE